MSGTASTDRTSGSHYRLSNGSNRILFPGKLFNEFVLVCITQEGLQVLGVMTRQQYEDAADMTRRITRIIAEDLASRGLELYDIKLEFGFAGGQVILMDEIASGNMRVYENGQVLDPIALTRRVLG